MAGATKPSEPQRWTVGDEIRSARIRARMDQADLAKAVGVARPTISKWERGISEPTLTQARAIARVTGDPYMLGTQSTVCFDQSAGDEVEVLELPFEERASALFEPAAA